MGIICAICGKKQSSLIQNYPISDYDFETHICPECYEHLNHLRASETQNQIEEEWPYFDTFLKSNTSTPVATSYLNSLLELSAKIADHLSINALVGLEHDELKKKEFQRITQAKNNLIVTTALLIEGYTIKKYLGLVFVSKISGIGLKTNIKSLGDIFASLTGQEFFAISSRISQLKEEALDALRLQAVQKGANALIGFVFETMLPGSSGIMVSINATAVIVEKNDA